MHVILAKHGTMTRYNTSHELRQAKHGMPRDVPVRGFRKVSKVKHGNTALSALFFSSQTIGDPSKNLNQEPSYQTKHLSFNGPEV